jgi:two-component system, sensor histidine kinase
MSPLSSIRLKIIVIIALLMIVPFLALGSAGIIYYENVIKHNIWDDNLGQAKAISALTVNYVDLSVNYLNSLATRPLVVSAIEERNSTYLNVTTQYAANESLEFDSIFVTDRSGNVLSYHSMYPDKINNTDQVGQSYYDQPFIRQVINTSGPYVSDATHNIVDGSTTIYIAVPIKDPGNNMIGVLVGSMDLINYTKIVVGTQVKNQQYIFLVNKSGYVMVHGNKSYMMNMTDFSVLPAVQYVMKGQEGVVEQEFPFEHDVRLAAYSPVPNYGWGVVVSLPDNVAYQPITQFTWYFLALIPILLLIAAILSVLFGNYLASPLVRMAGAAARIPETEPKLIEQDLPLGRKDEIGELARSLLAMANTIKKDRVHIISARDQAEDSKATMEKERNRAEDERQRAELYLDIMGHDINNLNQIALTNLELVKDDPTLNDDERRSISDSLDAVRGSAEIIDNVRLLQRISEQKLGHEKVDVNAMILDSVKEAPRPDDKIVNINFKPEKSMIVEASPLLKEVFRNLIDNSIKYSGNQVTIDINATEEMLDSKKYYVISLADNGFGIPEDIKPKLFTRFQRGTTKAHGKGLGLYIVRTLVEIFGGTVKLENRVAEDYSKGTRFIITLPLPERA